MGDPTPDVIKLKCKVCGTEFRLRPTKGRLPKGPVKCPECGSQIPVKSPSAAPMAAVIRPKRNSDSSNELDGLADALRNVPACGTLMGAPLAIGFDRQATKVVTLPHEMRIPSEVTEVDSGHSTSKRVPSHLDNLDETSESVFNNTTRHPWESENAVIEAAKEAAKEDSDPETEQRKTRPNLAPNTSGPKLSELLKKVRKKRETHPTQPMAVLAPPKRTSTEDIFGDIDAALDESVDDLAADAARALRTRKVKPKAKPLPIGRLKGGPTKAPSPKAPPTKAGPTKADPTIEAVIRTSLQSDLGMAGERKGSGYIRIPTAEILDVLGPGSYRLRVEDVVYEPVDEKGLVRLIKGGVLMGAEYIAESDGDWMPINDHPVIGKLKKMMAEEAHRLLAEVATAGPASEIEDDDPMQDLEEAFELEELVEESEAPPPLPVQDDHTIETGPPSDLPEPFAKPDEDTIPSMDVLGEAGLMNTSAVDEIAGAIARERPGLFDGTSVVDEIADAVEGAPERAVTLVDAEVPTHDSSEVPPHDSRVDDDLDETSAVYEDIGESLAVKKSKGPLIMLLLVLIAAGVAAAFALGLVEIPSADIPPAPDKKVDLIATTPDAGNDTGADTGEIAKKTPLEEAQAAFVAKPSVENSDTLATLLIDSGEKDKAIAVLEKGVTLEGGASLQPKLDQLKPPPPTPIGSQVLKADELESVTPLKVRKHAMFTADYKGLTYQFVPARKGNLKAYRALLAVGRLCEAIECGFEIPNINAWSMSRDEWKVFAKANKLRIDVEFVTTEQGTVVKGAMQALIADATPWPITKSNDWRKLVDSATIAEAPLTQTLAKWKNIDAIDKALGENGGQKAAKSLASLLVFDFLTNNFARLEKTPTTFVKDKTFYSVDNIDAFQARASTRVKGRFRWATRFNKEQVQTLRGLNPDVLNNALFPDATRQEKTALKVLWKQRDAILEKVDAQLKRKGEDATFF